MCSKRAQDATDVVPDGFPAEEELACDLVGRRAAGEKSEDLELAWCQTRAPRRTGGGLADDPHPEHRAAEAGLVEADGADFDRNSTVVPSHGFDLVVGDRRAVELAGELNIDRVPMLGSDNRGIVLADSIAEELDERVVHPLEDAAAVDDPAREVD